MAERTDGDPGPLQAVGTGPTQVAVGPDRGRVMIAFQYPTRWVHLDPQQAAEVAKGILDCASGLGANIRIAVPPKVIPPQVQITLVHRVAHIMRGALEGKKTPQRVAREIVDALLAATQ